MSRFPLPLWPLLFLLVLPFCLRAVEAVDTSFLRDYALTRGFMLGRPTNAKPTPDGAAVLFLRSPPRSPVMHLFQFDVATGKTVELLTPAQLLGGGEEVLSAEEKARRERMRQTARGFTTYELSEDGKQILVPYSGKLYLVDRATAKAKELPTGKGTLLDPKLSPAGGHVAYVLDHDLYVLDLATLQERRLTTGGTADVSHGLAEFVAQEEMYRYSGYWWAPDGKHLAYQETDNRDVEIWYVANPANPGAEPHAQRYPRPGKNNARVRLGVIGVTGGETTWVKWDREKYPYLAIVRWEKGGPLTIYVEDRRQQEALLLAVDHANGGTRQLLEEKDPAWINIFPDVPRWLEDSSGFLWLSERGGSVALERRTATGDLASVLLKDAGLMSVVHVDAREGRVVVSAGLDPTTTSLATVKLGGNPPVWNLPLNGQEAATYARNNAAVLVRRTTDLKTMPVSEVWNAGGKVGTLPSVAEDPPFLPTTTYHRFDQNGQSLDVSITRPRNFELHRGKKYPVLVDVYGGPHHLQVQKAMGSRLLAQWLADQGFIVVAIDNRGTTHRRGRAWERAIRGNFAQVPLEDQVEGLKLLGGQFPELDLERVGITGWSFGGYVSALAVLKRPDVFKAAVAGAPVTHWEDYDTHYTERYLGLPQENPNGYRESSLLTYADRLQRPLLLIHGTTDDNVYFAHTVKLSDALFKAGKDHEVLMLSGFTHLVPDPNVRSRLEERVVTFFKKHLGEPR